MADTNEAPSVFPHQVSSSAKRRRKGKEPELVIDGDMLVNTPKMIVLVYLSLGLLSAYFVQVILR